MDKGLRLVLLGKPQIIRDGVPVTGFVYNKALALLAYLAVTKRPHSRESPAGLLWGEMPDAAAKANLRKILSVLREVAGYELTIDRQTVAFDVESTYWLDTGIFEAKLHGLGASAHATGIVSENEVRQIEEAVGLYGGDFLEGFYVRSAPAFEEWALAERERLRQMALRALYRLVGHYTAEGNHSRGLDYATRLLALEPWHEEVHQQMMLLLALSGQRSAALNQFKVCRRLLADELGVEPNRDTVALYHRIARGEITAQPTFAPIPSDWPLEVTPFVGRAEELAKLAAYLVAPDSHLATVVGISGVGKTRLVLQGASQARRIFGQAVYYVPVAAASTPEAIAHTLMRALALPVTGLRNAVAQLISHLRDREMLIVLDQLEFHPGVPGFLQELIRQAPRVRLLIAASNRLNVTGEWVLPLYGLKIPASDAAADSWGSDAVQLFVQTVERVCGVCKLEEDQLPHVARICRLVEGLPLGIELAAAWSRLLSPQEIAHEIEKSYGFLMSSAPGASERHHSLTAAFDYTWGRMSLAERTLFQRLSVFRDGFAREAAEQVAGASLSTLAALMDKCLIQRALSGRYHIHSLLAQYGRQKLAEQPEAEAQVYERYCSFFTAFLQRRIARLDNAASGDHLSQIAAEHANLDAAWQWALAHSRQEAAASLAELATSERFMAAKQVFDISGARRDL